VTKTAFFENSRWRTAAIWKIALTPYLSRRLSDFDQIWYIPIHMTELIKKWNFTIRACIGERS